MPAKDIYHDTVKRALIKDGWTITAENLHLPWGGTNLYVDLGAEKVFIAEKKGQKIAVEVKSFSGRSEIVELENLWGNFFYIVLLCGAIIQTENCFWRFVKMSMKDYS